MNHYHKRDARAATSMIVHVAGRMPAKALRSPLTASQRAIRSFHFQSLLMAASDRLCPTTWRDARNMWKGATIATLLLSNFNERSRERH